MPEPEEYQKYIEILEEICDCDYSYPYASEDCPHKRIAWKMVYGD